MNLIELSAKNSLFTFNGEQIGFNGYRDEDNGFVFEDDNGNPFSIAPDNLEYIINWSNPNLPSSYYRELKVFVNKN